MTRTSGPKTPKVSAGDGREAALTGTPIIVVNWTAPFSLGASFAHEHSAIRHEEGTAAGSVRFVRDGLPPPYMVGLRFFVCEAIGTQANDHGFGGRAQRTYLAGDGPPCPHRAARFREANDSALACLYAEAAAAR